MKKSDAHNRVEQLICIHDAYNRLRDEFRPDDIWISMMDGIEVNEGIEMLADAVGTIPTIRQINLEDLKYEYSFTYKGVRFCQYGETDELPEVRWDA